MPSVSRAQVWEPPAAISATLASPLTATGVVLLVVVPLPSWPLPLLPQHFTVASFSRAQVWEPPAAISADAGQSPG